MKIKDINPENDYHEITQDIHDYVVQRDHGLCQILGCAGEEVHHILMKSLGGTNKPNNLILLSKRGHMIQHGLDKDTKAVSVKWLSEAVRRNEKLFRRRMI